MFTAGNVLSWATFFPLIGAAAIAALLVVKFLAKLPKKTVDQAARWIALVTSGLSFVAAIYAWSMFDGSKAGAQLQQHFVWIRSFNVEYFVGVDGLSISMVLLSGLVSFIATIASMPWWSGAKAGEMAGMVDDGHDDPHHPKHFSVRMVPGYMVMLLLLQTGMMGTFVSLDMFLFYVFWEVMLLPMYFLIGIWGGPRKEYAAIKFFLYTLAGSVLMLLAFIGLFIGFAIKIPMFPFHTWLPDAHVEAPTPVSVILAGVLLNMCIYGILRFNY